MNRKLPALLVLGAACCPTHSLREPTAFAIWAEPDRHVELGALHAYGFCITGVGTIDGIAVDADGDVAVAGQFHHHLDLGAGEIRPAQGDHGFVARYSADGGLRWAHTTDGAGHWEGYRAIAFTGDGGVVAAGSRMPVDSHRATGVVERFDAGGALVWSAEVEHPVGLAIAPDGGILVVGPAELTRLTPEGEHDWAARIGLEHARIAVATDGRIVVAGATKDAADLVDDATVVGLDAAGDEVWRHRATTTAVAGDYPHPRIDASAVTIDTGGRVFVAGAAADGTFDLGGNAIDAREAAGYLAAFDLDGNWVFTRTFPSRGAAPLAVAILSGGDLVIAGHFSGSIDLGGGALPDFDTLLWQNHDGFLARFTRDGEHRWSRRASWRSWTDTDLSTALSIPAVAAGPGGAVAVLSPGPTEQDRWHLGCVVTPVVDRIVIGDPGLTTVIDSP
jgi:hypothetical protein